MRWTIYGYNNISQPIYIAHIYTYVLRGAKIGVGDELWIDEVGSAAR